MHYYKRNLGDYAKKAGRLSMLQHGSYTLLIDACYDREQFPTFDEAIEWTWASTTEEIEAVTFVLRKFFVLEDGLYVQKRIQEELAEYHSKAETNKRIAIDRETKRKEAFTKRAKESTKRTQGVNEPPPNQEPRTNNQEPLVKDISPRALLEAESVPLNLINDWLKIRNKKRLPLTETALIATKREAQKANMTLEQVIQKCCEKSWAGFEASYLIGDIKQSNVKPLKGHGVISDEQFNDWLEPKKEVING